ncbi:hypothetical protein C2G38_2026910 [Gigaspora rosea]|uniref:Zn(2)-C6 fungal-type domain-containing protein n=1 Tax=Gigaspora rosea TaxID=44941 RepID=A0A397W8M6_9GLOM|nr:hypothetical protein C2G38_2026910 [Gigaspora rosea]
MNLHAQSIYMKNKNTPRNNKRNTKSCDNCRSEHIRCNYTKQESTCDHCKWKGITCQNTKFYKPRGPQPKKKNQKGRQFSTLYTKERLIKQFKVLKEQLVKEIKRTAHQFKEETKKELTISNTFESQNYIYIFDKKELSKLIPLNLLKNNLINEEQNRTLEELRRFRFNWKPISRPPRNKKAKRYPRNKDILESRELIQITDDIWNTINDLIDRINPTNNSRLGAILLTLEGAKSIAREFYPHILEYDKQRPNRIPPHILTRTATLFPDLTGRELAEEQKKQRNIYNNFLDNIQAQIEGIKKRLLAESPEFCKIFEDNPETEETEFYYGDYNNQFTILPFRFHHIILHHLEAIDNILYSE